jgi:Ca2+-binding EF-hand superfamily protein
LFLQKHVVEAVRVAASKELQSLPSLFAVLDDDKDGVISKSTLRHYLTSLGDAMKPEEVLSTR